MKDQEQDVHISLPFKSLQDDFPELVHFQEVKVTDTTETGSPGWGVFYWLCGIVITKVTEGILSKIGEDLWTNLKAALGKGLHRVTINLKKDRFHYKGELFIPSIILTIERGSYTGSIIFNFYSTLPDGGREALESIDDAFHDIYASLEELSKIIHSKDFSVVFVWNKVMNKWQIDEIQAMDSPAKDMEYPSLPGCY